jgi:hypothetical protein
MSSAQPVSCNSTPSAGSQLCCPTGYVCTIYASCSHPDVDTGRILDQRPCAELVDVLDANHLAPPVSTSASASANPLSSSFNLSPRSETFQIVFVYPAVVFAVLMAIAILACEMRRRRRRDLRDWNAARTRLSTRLGAASRRDDDPELPSYAEHWRTGAQLRVDVDSGCVQPPKYPEAVLDVGDPRAGGRAPRTPPPVYA